MKITIYAPFFIATNSQRSNGSLGGSAQQAHRLATYLENQGHRVTVICLKTPDASKTERYQNLKIRRIGLVNNGVGFDQEEFANEMIKSRPDAVVLFFLYYAKGEEALECLSKIERVTNCKTFIRFGRSDDFQRISPKTKDIIKRRHSILVNPTMEKLFSDFIPKAKYTVIENRVDYSKFRQFTKSYRRKLRLKYNISPNTYVALFTGRLVEAKGVDQFINALKKIPHDLNILGCFVGEDQFQKLKGYKGFSGELTRLQKEFPNRFRYIENIHHDKMPQMYNLADLFCLPSKIEGLSNSLVEADACGLELLVSNLEENKIFGAEVITDLSEQITKRAIRKNRVDNISEYNKLLGLDKF